MDQYAVSAREFYSSANQSRAIAGCNTRAVEFPDAGWRALQCDCHRDAFAGEWSERFDCGGIRSDANISGRERR